MLGFAFEPLGDDDGCTVEVAVFFDGFARVDTDAESNGYFGADGETAT